MHWLLLIVRFLLRALALDGGDSVAMGARIDGRVEQQRNAWRLWENAGWSPFAPKRRRDPVKSVRGAAQNRKSSLRASKGQSPLPGG